MEKVPTLPELLRQPRPLILEFASHADATKWRFRAYRWLQGRADVRMSVRGTIVKIEDAPLPVAPQKVIRMAGVLHGTAGFWVDNRCWKCDDGHMPCIKRSDICEYPHARND